MPKKHELTISYDVLDRNELSEEETKDLLSAIQARQNARAPQSGFTVGAAIRTNDEKVVTGHNFENIVFNVLHAEENALGNIPKKSQNVGLKRITVVGGPECKESEDPVYPCGLCRQKLMEVFKIGDKTMVIAAGTRGKVERIALKDLLPRAFFPDVLNKK